MMLTRHLRLEKDLLSHQLNWTEQMVDFFYGIGSEELEINQDIFKALEEDIPGAKLLLESTIGHELTHYFDDRDGLDFPGEEGQKFEEKVYGEDIDTLDDATRYLEE